MSKTINKPNRVKRVSNRLFRIYYTVFLTIIYFGLQLLMMKYNVWIMIVINTILMAIAINSIAKHYRKKVNSENSNIPHVGNSLHDLDGKTIPVTFRVNEYKPKVNVDITETFVTLTHKFKNTHLK